MEACGGLGEGEEAGGAKFCNVGEELELNLDGKGVHREFVYATVEESVGDVAAASCMQLFVPSAKVGLPYSSLAHYS